MRKMSEEEIVEYNNSNMSTTANLYWTSEWYFATPYGKYTYTDDNITDIHADKFYPHFVDEDGNDLTEDKLNHKLMSILIQDAIAYSKEKNKVAMILENTMPYVDVATDEHDEKFNLCNMPLIINAYFMDAVQITTPYGTYGLQDTKAFNQHGEEIFVDGLDENGVDVGEQQLNSAVFNLITDDCIRYRDEQIKKHYGERQTIY